MDLELIKYKTIPSVARANEVANGLIQAVEEGNLSAIEVRILSSYLGKVIEGISKLDKLRELAVKEAEEYGSKEDITILGAKIELCQTGVKYDYSNSSAWASLNERLETLKKEIKQVEDFAKVIKTNMSYIDRETGEELQIVPAGKSSTDNIKVSLSRKGE